MKKIFLLLFGFLLVHFTVYCQTQTGSGSISLTSTNLTTPYSQSFDSLSNSTSPSSILPSGWYFRESGTGNDSKYLVGDGATNTANTYSYGSGTSTDRAFGTLRGTSGFSSQIGAKFTNNTGSIITTLTIQFTGEQWRRGNGISNKPDNLSFHYSTDPTTTSLSTGGFVTDFNLDFGTQNKTVGAINGNTSSNRLATSWTLTGLNITPGSNFWIRWDDDVVVANAQEDGLAIDDFSILPGIATTSTHVFFANASLGPIPAVSNINFQIGVKATNGSSSSLTTADIVLVGGTGNASEIGISGVAPYSTQSIAFPANSNPSDQVVTIDIITPYTRSGNVTYIFQLQNVAGGISAVATNPIFDTVTIFYPITKTPSYYRTISSGDWSNSSTWESSLDNTSWTAATTSPDSSDLTISIRNTHIVDISIAVNIDETVIDVGGTLKLSNAGTNVTNGTGNDITVNGTFVHNGAYNSINFKTGSTMQVNSGGTVQVADNTNNVEAYASSSTIPITYSNGSYFYYTANKNFAGGTYFPNNTSSAIPTFRIGGNNNISNGSAVTINGNFEVFTSSSFKNNASFPLTINNGNFTNNGLYTSNGGTVIFNGTVSQSILGNNSNFSNLNFNNTTNVSNESNQSITGILTLGASAKFDPDGSTDNSIFTFRSLASSGNTTSDASIANVPIGATISGKVNVERYLANGIQKSRVYRYLASPVTGASVQDWKNTIPITGIFSDPSLSGSYDGVPIVSGSPSLFIYDESLAGISAFSSANFLAYPTSGTAASNPLILGKGYSLFIRRATPATSIVTLNVTGNPAIGDQSLNFNYTNATGDITNDGFNLVGNPFISAIDWTKVSIPTGLDNSVYIKDNTGIGPSAGNFVSLVNLGGVVLSNSSAFNGHIASSQGFYIKANGAVASGTLTISESAKISSATFYRENTSLPSDLIRLKMKSKTDSIINDETVVYFNQDAKDTYDGKFDAFKLNNDVISLGSFNSSDSIKYSINGLGYSSKKGEFSKEVNLFYSIKQKGEYQFDLFSFENFNKNTNIYLKDNLLNTMVNLKANSSYSFQADSLYDKGRFKLMFTNMVMGTENSQEKIGLKLYPNPVNKELYIESGGFGNLVKVRVYNLQGLLIVEKYLTKQFLQDNKAFYLLDVQNLSNGLYIISLEDGKSQSSIKFVKE